MARSRILVIDDEPLMREYVEETLIRAGYDTATASGGREGIELLKARSFDLVVTDLKMTPVDGLAVLREVKDNALAEHCIVMTAYGTIETAVAALKAGADDYILNRFRPMNWNWPWPVPSNAGELPKRTNIFGRSCARPMTSNR